MHRVSNFKSAVFVSRAGLDAGADPREIRQVRDDAQRSFPPNCACKTLHQLAFAKVGRKYPQLADDVKVLDAVAALRDAGLLDGGSSRGSPVALAAAAVRCLGRWLASADPALTPAHAGVAARHAHGAPAAAPAAPSAWPPAAVLAAAVALWATMKDPLGPQRPPMTLAGMLKLWTLGQPDLGEYDAVSLRCDRSLNGHNPTPCTPAQLAFCVLVESSVPRRGRSSLLGNTGALFFQLRLFCWL
jgi:hypothetical protein